MLCWRTRHEVRNSFIASRANDHLLTRQRLRKSWFSYERGRGLEEAVATRKPKTKNVARRSAEELQKHHLAHYLSTNFVVQHFQHAGLRHHQFVLERS